MVGTADSVLIREVSFIYREVLLYTTTVIIILYYNNYIVEIYNKMALLEYNR